MRTLAKREEEYDVVVIGGGLAGVCAAASAARLGSKTALVQDRPVLGGMSSSECRTIPVGATAMNYRRHSRETGIIEEVEMESWHRMEGYKRRGALPYPLWDLILKEWVDREPNATLHLNSYAMDVESDEGLRILGIRAVQITTEKILTLRAPMFIDASGDGTVAYLAGADYRVGREGRAETNESRAVEVADDHVLPSTLRYLARDWGRPVAFIPPPWARQFTECDDLPFRNHRRFNTGHWWIAWGGTSNTISDAERIRDELQSAQMGVWDHVKNQADHGAENFALEWIGMVPCKRESRRFLGDYVLTQQDIEGLADFDDKVAYGGWPIDLHPPEGIDSSDPPTNQPQLPAPYSIPLRCLYSRNVPNLFLAGRNISQTHVALGSSRVMKTCATMGQAVGTAASFCARLQIGPRELERGYISEVQQQLLKDDAFIINLRNRDRNDLALDARVRGTSSTPLATAALSEWKPLDVPRSQLIPISAGRVDAVALLVRSSLEDDHEITVALRQASNVHDFGTENHTVRNCSVPAETSDWVRVEVDSEIEPGLYQISVEPKDDMAWGYGNEMFVGTQAAEWTTSDIPGESEEKSWAAAPKNWLDKPEAASRMVARVGGATVMPDDASRSRVASGATEFTGYEDDGGSWKMIQGSYCLRVEPASYPYEPVNVNNGVARPHDWPNIWISDPSQGLPQSIEFDFGREVEVGMLQITFNSNLDLDHVGRIVGHVPECVRDYRVLYTRNGDWQQLFSEQGVHQRFRRHRFEPVRARQVRVVIERTWGAATAQVYEVRAYGADT
jgi:hypothetical protein